MPEGSLDPDVARGRDADERMRFDYFDAAEHFTDYLCATLADARLLVKTEDEHVGRRLFAKQRRGDIKTLRRCVTVIMDLLGGDAITGRTFIDVGANIGSTIIPGLLTLPFADGVALEPEPENFLTLRLNVLLNGLEDRVTALQVAASNVVAELTLMVNRTRSGNHWIATGARASAVDGKHGAPSTIPAVTLDSLAGHAFDPDRVGLLWMDAENHEGQILEGATELLRHGVPIAFEWNRKRLESRGNLANVVEAAGEHYTHFLDLRASKDPTQPKFQLRPTSELGDYGHTDEQGRERFTDILVLRLATLKDDADVLAILGGKSQDARRGLAQRLRRR